MLSQERIHHVNNPACCPYCHEYDQHFAGTNPDNDNDEQQSQREWLEGHRQLAADQHAAFGHDRDCLRCGTNNRHIIIVHDFSQVPTSKHNYQDYVLVSQERHGTNDIKQSVFHFIASDHQEDHNEEFVEDAWPVLLAHPNGMAVVSFHH